MNYNTKFKKTEIGMIPKDWNLFKASEYCYKITDGTHDSPKKSVNGKFLITSRHIKGNTIDFNNAYLISKEDYDTINKRSYIDKYDILFSMIGTIGESFLIKKTPDYAIKNIGLFKFKENLSKSKWFYYFLKSSYAKKYIASRSSGSTQQYITLSSLRNFPVAVPSSEQERDAIAKILSDLDSKIELLQEQNKTLEKIGQTIFKHWFVDFEFPNEEGKPYKSSGGKMVFNEELGQKIPEGWVVGHLDDSLITELIKIGINKFSGEKIYLDTASVHNSDIIDISTKITISERPSRANMQPIPKSIWFAKMKDSKKVILINNFDIYLLNNMILSTGFAGIKIKDDFLYYIWLIINSNKFENIKNSLCLGTTMQAINNLNIKKIKYLIPSKKIISKLNESISVNYKKISLNKLQISELQKIRDLLLLKLITGKIRVSLEDDKK